MCDILNPYAKETGGGRNDTGTLDRRTGIQKRARAAGGETSLHAAPEKSDRSGVGAAAVVLFAIGGMCYWQMFGRF